MDSTGNGLASYASAAAIGAVAGLRTMTPAFALNRASGGIRSAGLGLAAAGELIGDKLPITPSRRQRPQLMARITAGATAGGAVASRRGHSRIVGGLLGGVAAFGSAHAGYRIRRALVDRAHLPEPLVALAEDAIAVASALAIANALPKRT